MDNRIMRSRKLGALTEDLGEFTPSEQRQINMQRGLIRRDLIHTTTYSDQVTRGRPHADWSMCGNDKCSKGRYTEEGMLVLRRATFLAPSAPLCTFMPDTPIVEVAPRYEVFIHHIVQDQFQTPAGSGLYEDLRSQVRSFSNSPPVRSALYNFRVNITRAGLDPAPWQLARLFSDLRGACIYMVKLERFCGFLNFPWITDAHEFFRPAGQPRPRNWGLRQFVFEFCTILEAWRRFAQRNVEGTDWRFMRPSVAGNFYLCLLLNEWCMLKNEQLYDEHCTKIHLLKVWDDWFKDHVRIDLAEVERDNMNLLRKTNKNSREDDEDGDGDRGKDDINGSEGGCVVAGVGQLNPSWQSARLKASTTRKASRTADQQQSQPISQKGR